MQPGEQTIESFLYGASRASHVDANEIMPVAAILGTFGEHHLMIALEMFAQQSGIVRQFRTIDPQQVGGMAFNQGDASFRCRGSIVFVLIMARASALLPVKYARNSSSQGSLSLKAASVAVMAKAFGSATSSVYVERTPYLMPQHGIWNHYGRVKTGDIERFGRCHVGHGVHCALLIHRGKGHVIISRIGKITMNFVADYGHMMVPAKLTYACEGVAIPDLAYGIVWIAQDHQRGLRIGQLGFPDRPS